MKSPFKLVDGPDGILRAEFQLPDDGCPAPQVSRLVMDVYFNQATPELHIYTMSPNDTKRVLSEVEVEDLTSLCDLLYGIARIRRIPTLELV